MIRSFPQPPASAHPDCFTASAFWWSDPPFGQCIHFNGQTSRPVSRRRAVGCGRSWNPETRRKMPWTALQPGAAAMGIAWCGLSGSFRDRGTIRCVKGIAWFPTSTTRQYPSTLREAHPKGLSLAARTAVRDGNAGKGGAGIAGELIPVEVPRQSLRAACLGCLGTPGPGRPGKIAPRLPFGAVDRSGGQTETSGRSWARKSLR